MKVPLDIVRLILREVKIESLGACAAVCRAWRGMVSYEMKARRTSDIRSLTTLSQILKRTDCGLFSVDTFDSPNMELKKIPTSSLEHIKTATNIIGPVEGDGHSLFCLIKYDTKNPLNTVEVYIGKPGEDLTKYKFIYFDIVKFVPTISWVKIGFFITGDGIVHINEEGVFRFSIFSDPEYGIMHITPLTEKVGIAEFVAEKNKCVAFLTLCEETLEVCLLKECFSFHVDENLTLFKYEEKFVISLKRLLAPIALHAENRIIFIK